eukprot:scaffold343_cov245-Pinguiococcus_pyrenoidosus.AAC.15
MIIIRQRASEAASASQTASRPSPKLRYRQPRQRKNSASQPRSSRPARKERLMHEAQAASKQVGLAQQARG